MQSRKRLFFTLGCLKCKTLLEAPTRFTCKPLIILAQLLALAALSELVNVFLAAFVLSTLAQEIRFWRPSVNGAVRVKAWSHRAPLVWVLAWCKLC